VALAGNAAVFFPLGKRAADAREAPRPGLGPCGRGHEKEHGGADRGCAERDRDARPVAVGVPAEPGREEDETILTGASAAVAGGFTSIACIPNTEPPIDTQASVEFIQHQAARADLCNVYVVACVSKNREGKELAELGQLVEAGAVAFSDDGAPVYDAELMRRALEYCTMFNKPSRPEGYACFLKPPRIAGIRDSAPDLA